MLDSGWIARYHAGPMSYLPGTKEALRCHCKVQRRTLGADQRAAADAGVLRSLLSLPEFDSARWIHSYVSMAECAEVDTLEFIAVCLRSDKRVAVPWVQTGGKEMRHARILAETELRRTHMGLLQPLAETCDWVNDHSVFDLIVVPGLAFDRFGRRLGYGGGYYDRFLNPLCALCIGLTYECLLLDEVPSLSHDVAVDMVITETKIYHGGRL